IHPHPYLPKAFVPETLANTWLSSLLQTLFPPLSCFSAMLFSAPRRFLALRTKIAAAPRHDHALNSRLAAKARFPLSSIRSMMPLIFSRLAFRVKKVRDRGSAHHNRPLQDALQRAVQFFHLLLPQPRSQPHRMDPGFPQALIGVDVSHAAQNPLIQQQRLDSCTLSTDSRRELLQPRFQRIRAESPQLLLQRFARKIRHPAKSPRVDVPQFAPIVQ